MVISPVNLLSLREHDCDSIIYLSTPSIKSCRKKLMARRTFLCTRALKMYGALCSLNPINQKSHILDLNIEWYPIDADIISLELQKLLSGNITSLQYIARALTTLQQVFGRFPTLPTLTTLTTLQQDTPFKYLGKLLSTMAEHIRLGYEARHEAKELKAYGTGFHMTFDILYHGKTANAAWENIFRIGHAGHSLTDFKCSKNDRFPAMWVDDNSNAFIFDVSDKSNCFRQYKNHIILPNILYSVTISYNSSWVYISLNNTIIVNEPRKDITDINIIGTDVYIYISTATGTPANVILSNIKILSYYDNSYIPQTNPSFNPTISPTYNPSNIPTISPTINIQQSTNIPTLSTINNSPTKKPTTFFPSIFTQYNTLPDDTIFTTDDTIFTTENQLHAHATTISSTVTNTIYEYINTIYETDNNISKTNGGLSFEVIFYILTGCAMGGILFCVCTCCCFGCIINKKIKTLATDETNIEYDIPENENILSKKKKKMSMHVRDVNNNNNIIHLSNKNNNYLQDTTINKIRIHTISDGDTNDESVDSQNIINGSSPTTSPSNCKYSSPSSIMSKSIHSFGGNINSNANSPNTKFIVRSQLQKHLSPKDSNNTIRRVNTKSVPIININELLNEDITLNNHKVAIQRNEISKSTPDIGAITIDFMDNNNNETDNETDNDSTDEDTDDDCKIISTNHALLSPLNNSNNSNNNHNNHNKHLGDGYERGHFFECRNINNKSKLNKVIHHQISNPSTNYSLYVHSSGTATNNKYKSLSNNNSNLSTNNMNQIAIDKSKQYQIQIDMATDDNNNTLTGEHNDDNTDDDDESTSNSNSNSQYENEQLYEIKSLGDIEMESNQQEQENEDEEDMKNETIMNTTSHPNTSNIKPNSAKSFKSYKTIPINNRIIARTHSHNHSQHAHTVVAHCAPHQVPHAILMNNISESGQTQSAKVFLQLPATADSQMSAESISSNQSIQSSTSCSTSISNSSNASSSSYSSSNSSSTSCSSSSNSSSQYSSINSTNNTNNYSNSNSSSTSCNSNSSINSTTYNKTHYTNTTNNTPLVDVSNNDKFHRGNNQDNMSQSTAYYTNTPHSL